MTNADDIAQCEKELENMANLHKYEGSDAYKGRMELFNLY